MKKYELDDEGEYINEERPSFEELTQMYMMEVLYTDFIISKPTFALNLKANMTATGNDTRLLDPALQNELPNLLEYAYKKGVANYSIMATLMKVWAS